MHGIWDEAIYVAGTSDNTEYSRNDFKSFESLNLECVRCAKLCRSRITASSNVKPISKDRLGLFNWWFCCGRRPGGGSHCWDALLWSPISPFHPFLLSRTIAAQRKRLARDYKPFSRYIYQLPNPQIFRWLVLACTKADFGNRILILKHFSRSTRFTSFHLSKFENFQICNDFAFFEKVFKNFGENS